MRTVEDYFTWISDVAACPTECGPLTKIYALQAGHPGLALVQPDLDISLAEDRVTSRLALT